MTSEFETWKGGNMLYPVPAVLVTCADGEGRQNVLTVAWAGTVCTNPPMVSVSIRPQRYSYGMIHETGEFVINLTTRDMAFAVDYCGVRSGRDVDKFQQMKLERQQAELVGAPLLAAAPVSMECRVRQELVLGSHTMFVAQVLRVHVRKSLLDEKNRLLLENSGLMVYAHGKYFGLGKELGSFGYSVKRRRKHGAK